MQQVRFELGQIYITRRALKALDTFEVFEGVRRHQRGDWGNVCKEDAKENELSLREGFRLLSAYTDSGGTLYWIITEADRSSTTILLPSEY